MRFTLISARKDLSRLGRDPLALLTALGIPLVLVALITLVFGGRGATPQGKLLIADEDKTFVSRTIRSAFGNEPVSKMIAMESVEREDGLRRMDRGEAPALLHAALGQRLDRGPAPNASNPSTPARLEETPCPA